MSIQLYPNDENTECRITMYEEDDSISESIPINILIDRMDSIIMKIKYSWISRVNLANNMTFLVVPLACVLIVYHNNGTKKSYISLSKVEALRVMNRLRDYLTLDS